MNAKAIIEKLIYLADERAHLSKMLRTRDDFDMETEQQIHRSIQDAEDEAFRLIEKLKEVSQ